MHSARSDAPPSAIWDSLTRVETWEKIPGVDQVTSSRSDESGNLDAFTFIATIGGRPYRGTARLRDRVEPSRMAWDIDSPDVRGSIAVDLAPDDGGTTVTVALTVAVDGFLASMFFPAITQALGRGFPDAVAEFAASLSS